MYYIKEFVREKVTDFCIHIIKKVNRFKNRCLSKRLFYLAETYNNRPKTYNYNKRENHTL